MLWVLVFGFDLIPAMAGGFQRAMRYASECMRTLYLFVFCDINVLIDCVEVIRPACSRVDNVTWPDAPISRHLQLDATISMSSPKSSPPRRQ